MAGASYLTGFTFCPIKSQKALRIRRNFQGIILVYLQTILHIQQWFLYHAIRNIFVYMPKMTLKNGQNL